MRIVVIGCGIVGTLTARELCRYEAEVTLIDRAPDVGMGVSKANSGIVHAGYDDEPETVRARFCVPGNRLFDALARELDFDIRRVGSHVVAFREEDRATLQTLKERGEKNGLDDLLILSSEELHHREPNLNPAAVASLWAPTAGIVEPWQICIAAAENAVANGARLRLEETVTGIEVDRSAVRAVVTDKDRYPCDAVVNAAGLFADRIAHLAGDEAIPLNPRRGEYILLNKFTVHDLVKSVLFPVPGASGKGILVTPTVDKGILLGPTADDLPRSMKDDRATTREGLDRIVAGARLLIPRLDLRETVKVFSGSRPESPGRDFWLGRSGKVQGLVHAGATRSPGLTAAPAIARFLAAEVLAALGGALVRRADFRPERRRIRSFLREMSREALDRAIAEDPAAGRVVCVCNKVTEKEIVEAIRRGARTLDGLKFRTRALFGECQGGFCTHGLLKILARELGRPLEELDYGGDGSWVAAGKVRP